MKDRHWEVGGTSLDRKGNKGEGREKGLSNKEQKEKLETKFV